MTDEPLTLGVLGGMGPAATVEFLARLQAYTPAEKDQDHIRVIADINPRAPDRNVPGSGAGAVLAEMAGALHGAGAEVLHAPREWPEYHPGYYGVFLRDLDRHNVEAVHHGW